ncbi:MAG: DUF1801 domain-containing protein [Pseudomonadota bacterium]
MDDFDKLHVATKFASYPEDMRAKLLLLRKLILETAASTSPEDAVEETLKWSEPSYILKGGSTIRIDWKASNPDYYAMYFNCNTKLVDTFKELYSGVFNFEGNRAIVFHRGDRVQAAALRRCIAMALQYHRLKHLPLLGA